MLSEKIDFFNLISSRHSVRAFKEKSVSSEIIKKILTAATKAASAGNLQSYQIFVVTKERDKKKLAIDAHEQNFIKDAPVILVFCADPENAREYGQRGMELFCIQDATLACCYAQLAVQALGLSSVWVGSFDEDKVSRDLNITKSLKPVSMLVIGYADEKPEITNRRPLEQISHQV